MVATALFFSLCSFIVAEPGKSKKPLLARDVYKTAEQRGEPVSLEVNIEFFGEYGETVTDENGTSYHMYGETFYEDKVYPPEYWGVFPLYFWDTEVGITTTVRNTSDSRDTTVRMTTESYCLGTDGSNGAELAPKTATNVTLAAGTEKVIDTSFIVGYTPDADSGLDRFIIKLFNVEDDGAHVVGGEININPNNNPDNEFTVTLPDDSAIARDDLTQDYAGYSGSAKNVHVKPKGNGNQNGLIVDGEQYTVENGNSYDIASDSMTVNLYNDNVNPSGKAVGKWWIAITAGDATITVLNEEGGGAEERDDEDDELITTEEGVFCPPENEGKILDILQQILAEQ